MESSVGILLYIILKFQCKCTGCYQKKRKGLSGLFKIYSSTFSMVAEPCKSLGMENKLPSIHEHRVGALAWTKVFSLGFILENSITIWIFNCKLDPGGIQSLYR